MRVYMSATLTKVLLGIASAGALFVSPVRAETAPTSDSAEALKEAPATSDVSSPSPSGAEQLLPLNPPSPVEPAGAAELQPITPASSLESPEQAVPETTEDGVSVDAAETPSSDDDLSNPGDVSTSEEDLPPVGASDDPALDESESAFEEPDSLQEETEVTAEEGDSFVIDESSNPEEDAPLVDGTDNPALEESESATGEPNVFQQEADGTIEEDNSSAIGGAEELAPAEGISTPPEDSTVPGDTGLENSDSEEPQLLEEDGAVDEDEESDISPSSAIPDASSQLVAEGDEPAAATEASPEDATTAPSTTSPDPSATAVSDEELQKFATALPELSTVEQNTQQEISAVIQGAGFDEARFREIYQSQQSPDASAAEVTDDEQASFSQALSDIQQIGEKSKVEQEKIIQAQGLETERLKEIITSLNQDPALQAKFKQMISN